MKKEIKYLLVFIIITGFVHVKAQQVPYNLVPDWQSVAGGKYATGLGIADMNNDGWKDIVISNGNDMARQGVEIYYNNGDGTFPTSPGWESYDIDYHGHLAVGDLNSDGFNDVVVSVFLGSGGFGHPGKIKVYYNQNGDLDTVPGFQSDSFYTFSCTLGDADSDGDLDIAVASSEMYNGVSDHVRIFLNDNGNFQQTPEWISTEQHGAMDIEFADMDNNGFLDLIVGCQETANVVFYADNTGTIQNYYTWKSGDQNVNTNSIDVADINQDSFMDLVLTNNDQLGGDGRLRAYCFNGAMPDSSYADWMSGSFDYASGILLYDVDNDGLNDLIHGGWWEPVKIHLGNGIAFDSIPAYTSTSSSVVEIILAADLGKEAVIQKTDTIIVQQNTSIVYLQPKLIDNIETIIKNGTVITSGYCNVPGRNLLSFAGDLVAGDTIIITYSYSPYCDLVISNWDTNRGNYIFYNTDNSGVQNEMMSDVVIFPVPADDFVVVNIPGNITYDYKLFDIRGELVSTGVNRSGSKISLKNMKSGIFILEIIGKHFHYTEKIILK